MVTGGGKGLGEKLVVISVGYRWLLWVHWTCELAHYNFVIVTISH